MVVRWSDVRINETRNAVLRLEPPYLIRQSGATIGDFESISTEDFRCELIDGTVIMHSPATVSLEARITFLTVLLGGFVSKHKLGRVFSSNAVMQIGERCFCPDLSFLSALHSDRIRDERVHGAMDLVVEVVSKTTRSYDLGEKRACYREARVPEIWLIDPFEREFHVDWLKSAGTKTHGEYQTELLEKGCRHSRAIPNFWIDVEWLWTDPLPNDFECLTSILS